MAGPAKPFHFKQFTVHDDRCSLKVGTDAVLLGAWANVASVTSVLDIGTGSGVMALMLAQRTGQEVQVDAVEISEPDAVQARENAAQSLWMERISVHCCSIQEFETASAYDLIVSNPPYFVDSLLPPEAGRVRSRHVGSLSYEDLLTVVVRLLAPDGRFCVILPPVESMRLQTIAAARGLYPLRRLEFHSRKEKPVERIVTEYRRSRGAIETKKLYLYDEGNTWSAEYKVLTGEFYQRKSSLKSKA